VLRIQFSIVSRYTTDDAAVALNRGRDADAAADNSDAADAAATAAVGNAQAASTPSYLAVNKIFFTLSEHVG
jgi:hypothetical protein